MSYCVDDQPCLDVLRPLLLEVVLEVQRDDDGLELVLRRSFGATPHPDPAGPLLLVLGELLAVEHEQRRSDTAVPVLRAPVVA